VYAEVVEIHGRVTGHFFASKCIILTRHASLTGGATAQSISVEPGAVLNGQVQVHSPDRSSLPALEPVLAAG
jgi:cytoskeletal protein CcmA (bactofilin family)